MTASSASRALASEIISRVAMQHNHATLNIDLHETVAGMIDRAVAALEAELAKLRRQVELAKNAEPV